MNNITILWSSFTSQMAGLEELSRNIKKNKAIILKEVQTSRVKS